jgi:hypothetical protein
VAPARELGRRLERQLRGYLSAHAEDGAPPPYHSPVLPPPPPPSVEAEAAAVGPGATGEAGD